MLGRSKIPFLLIISFITVLLIVLICPSNQQVSSQTSEGVVPLQTQIESIKIDNPISSQNASMGKELIISGHSSDNSAKNCSVSLIVNDVRPYQNAVAKGTGGINDFSRWEFSLRDDYTQIMEGENKITAKLLCVSAPTRWYSVVVNGVPNNNVSETLPPVESSQQSNVSEPSSSDIKKVDTNDSQLVVTILPQKDPVARGDTQNTTITVTDSNNRAIANAQIDGKLIYPGDNFEKEFKGITDYQGKFVYSWTVGKKGDVGPLVIDVEASSEGYPSTSANNSFEIVKSDESSEIKNPFQSHFQRP